MNSENLSAASLGLMQFTLEILGKPRKFSPGVVERSQGTKSQNSSPDSYLQSRSPEDVYSKIYAETSDVSQFANSHRLKIQKIYEGVKETVNFSNYSPSSPFLSRPHSSASYNYCDSQKEMNCLTLFPRNK